jgi:hypothetical protein
MACTPSQDPLQQLLTCVGNSLQHGRRAAAAFLGGAQQHLRNHMQPLHASNPAHSGSTESPATVNSHSLRSTAGQTSVARVAPLAAATLHTQLHPGSSYVRSHSSSGTSTSEDSEVRKAELGRATWTLLHMMAAQYPERPSRQQQRDAAAFINTLARVYPCGSCGAHFQEILRYAMQHCAYNQPTASIVCHAVRQVWEERLKH